jgi:hypothetical protein
MDLLFSTRMYSGSYIESYFIYFGSYTLNVIYIMKSMMYLLKFSKGCGNLTNSGGGNHISIDIIYQTESQLSISQQRRPTKQHLDSEYLN